MSWCAAWFQSWITSGNSLTGTDIKAATTYSLSVKIMGALSSHVTEVQCFCGRKRDEIIFGNHWTIEERVTPGICSRQACISRLCWLWLVLWSGMWLISSLHSKLPGSLFSSSDLCCFAVSVASAQAMQGYLCSCEIQSFYHPGALSAQKFLVTGGPVSTTLVPAHRAAITKYWLHSFYYPAMCLERLHFLHLLSSATDLHKKDHFIPWIQSKALYCSFINWLSECWKLKIAIACMINSNSSYFFWFNPIILTTNSNLTDRRSGCFKAANLSENVEMELLALRVPDPTQNCLCI